MDIQVKRGKLAASTALTHKQGEPVFTTDTKELYVGDGTTPGGIPVGTVKPSGTIVKDAIALFKDATGKVLYSITKADFLNGYATEKFVTDNISAKVPAIKVDTAKLADKATDAASLKGRSDYINSDALTDSYQEDSSNKVVTAKGVKALWDNVKAQLTSLTTTKVDKASITSSLTSTDATKVLSAAGGKALNDKVTTNASNVQAALTASNKASSDAAQAKVSSDAAQAIGNAAKLASATNTAHLAKLPPKMSQGTAAPSGGNSGDVYLQYK